jgi:hypothetical protein
MNDQQESDQIRDVYAHFGLAVYLAQCVEQSIFQHLLFLDHFPKAIAEFTSKEAWVSAFDEFEARELGQTMGKLIRRMKEAGQPTDQIQALLTQTLKQRNWLAHGYFADRAVEFTRELGREKMIPELEELQALFREAAAKIDALTMPVARKYGLTEEALANLMASLVESHDASAQDTDA